MNGEEKLGGGGGANKSLKPHEETEHLKDWICTNTPEFAHQVGRGYIVAMHKDTFATDTRVVDHISYFTSTIGDVGSAALELFTPGTNIPMYPVRLTQSGVCQPANRFLPRVVLLSGAEHVNISDDDQNSWKWESVGDKKLFDALEQMMPILSDLSTDQLRKSPPLALMATYPHQPGDRSAREAFIRRFVELYMPSIVSSYGDYVIYLTGDAHLYLALSYCDLTTGRGRTPVVPMVDSDVQILPTELLLPIDNKRLNQRSIHKMAHAISLTTSVLYEQVKKVNVYEREYFRAMKPAIPWRLDSNFIPYVLSTVLSDIRLLAEIGPPLDSSYESADYTLARICVAAEIIGRTPDMSKISGLVSEDDARIMCAAAIYSNDSISLSHVRGYREDTYKMKNPIQTQLGSTMPYKYDEVPTDRGCVLQTMNNSSRRGESDEFARKMTVDAMINSNLLKLLAFVDPCNHAVGADGILPGCKLVRMVDDRNVETTKTSKFQLARCLFTSHELATTFAEPMHRMIACLNGDLFLAKRTIQLMQSIALQHVNFSGLTKGLMSLNINSIAAKRPSSSVSSLEKPQYCRSCTNPMYKSVDDHCPCFIQLCYASACATDLSPGSKQVYLRPSTIYASADHISKCPKPCSEMRNFAYVNYYTASNLRVIEARSTYGQCGDARVPLTIGRVASTGGGSGTDGMNATTSAATGTTAPGGGVGTKGGVGVKESSKEDFQNSVNISELTERVKASCDYRLYPDEFLIDAEDVATSPYLTQQERVALTITSGYVDQSALYPNKHTGRSVFSAKKGIVALCSCDHVLSEAITIPSLIQSGYARRIVPRRPAGRRHDIRPIRQLMHELLNYRLSSRGDQEPLSRKALNPHYVAVIEDPGMKPSNTTGSAMLTAITSYMNGCKGLIGTGMSQSLRALGNTVQTVAAMTKLKLNRDSTAPATRELTITCRAPNRSFCTVLDPTNSDPLQMINDRNLIYQEFTHKAVLNPGTPLGERASALIQASLSPTTASSVPITESLTRTLVPILTTTLLPATDAWTTGVTAICQLSHEERQVPVNVRLHRSLHRTVTMPACDFDDKGGKIKPGQNMTTAGTAAPTEDDDDERYHSRPSTIDYRRTADQLITRYSPIKLCTRQVAAGGSISTTINPPDQLLAEFLNSNIPLHRLMDLTTDQRDANDAVDDVIRYLTTRVPNGMLTEQGPVTVDVSSDSSNRSLILDQLLRQLLSIWYTATDICRDVLKQWQQLAGYEDSALAQKELNSFKSTGWHPFTVLKSILINEPELIQVIQTIIVISENYSPNPSVVAASPQRYRPWGEYEAAVVSGVVLSACRYWPGSTTKSYRPTNPLRTFYLDQLLAPKALVPCVSYADMPTQVASEIMVRITPNSYAGRMEDRNTTTAEIHTRIAAKGLEASSSFGYLSRADHIHPTMIKRPCVHYGGYSKERTSVLDQLENQPLYAWNNAITARRAIATEILHALASELEDDVGEINDPPTKEDIELLARTKFPHEIDENGHTRDLDAFIRLIVMHTIPAGSNIDKECSDVGHYDYPMAEDDDDEDVAVDATPSPRRAIKRQHEDDNNSIDL